MKTLLIGIIAFLGWTGISNYWYVCRIKGLCEETESFAVVAEPPPVAAAKPVEESPPPPASESEPPSNSNTAEAEPVVESFDEVITFHSQFASGNYVRDAAADQVILELKAFLAANPNHRVIITGHTDAVGSSDFNKALGMERAQRVKAHMIDLGIPNSVITTRSAGETQPIASNSSESGRYNNRRIEIIVQ